MSAAQKLSKVCSASCLRTSPLWGCGRRYNPTLVPLQARRRQEAAQLCAAALLLTQAGDELRTGSDCAHPLGTPVLLDDSIPSAAPSTQLPWGEGAAAPSAGIRSGAGTPPTGRARNSWARRGGDALRSRARVGAFSNNCVDLPDNIIDRLSLLYQ